MTDIPLFRTEAENYLKEMPGWALDGNSKIISKEFTFADFAQAMEFANKIAALAEEEGHHPDLLVSWGKVKVELSTHSIGGLSKMDFSLAAKIEAIQ
jgi:4a-hydroxytetrahydrobiopterin dehydratase